MNQLILYSTHSSSRLSYVLEFVFAEVLGINVLQTQSESVFTSSELFKINYSHKALVADIHIESVGLLYEDNIVEKEIIVSSWKELPIFFQTNYEDIPFDIFSSVFYLLSRYEEYLPYEPDEYKRFPHVQSLAFKNNFLNLPLIDLWIMELKSILLRKNNSFIFAKQQVEFLPTYDIDIAYSYKGKGLERNVGGALKDLANGNVNLVKQRVSTLFFNQRDPYDSYQWLDEIHQKYKLQPIYFFLLSSGGEMDKNLSVDTDEMKTLLASVSQKYDVGIHPSWQSHDDIIILDAEINKLNSTSKSRQHYIRFTLPETYRNLINVGISEDYSMGYGSINGFRASTSRDFYWFDLLANSISSLRLYPFCFMECNSFFEQKMNPSEALDELNSYFEAVKKVDGRMISIWHNFSLGSDPLWKGWKEVYQAFLSKNIEIKTNE